MLNHYGSYLCKRAQLYVLKTIQYRYCVILRFAFFYISALAIDSDSENREVQSLSRQYDQENSEKYGNMN